MVARELATDVGLRSYMTEERITECLKSLLNHLHDRAEDQIRSDDESPDALLYTHEYLVASATIRTFGSQLLAFEDIERDDSVIAN